MWNSSGNVIEMSYGDFGVELPVKISGIEFGQNDSIRLRISDTVNKTFTPEAENTINIFLTQEESESLKPGVYGFTLDWFNENVFRCNVLSCLLHVVEK